MYKTTLKEATAIPVKNNSYFHHRLRAMSRSLSDELQSRDW
jgi:NADH:ubiquinone oxidoreductase subunit